MDFIKLLYRFKQFGGGKLALEYVRIGALGAAVKKGVTCLIKRQSFKAIYPEVLKCVEPFLTERYAPIVQEFKVKGVQANTYHPNVTNKASIGLATVRPIWFCWLQGLENAPKIVHACYNSIQKNLVQEYKSSNVQGYVIKVIDGKNWNEYVELPDYIVKKWEKKRIPAALFSDMLRLELLIKYGGTWIDSTVLCTGFKFQDPSFKYLDSDLFLFQYTKEGSIPVSISNWFITACSNNEVLMVLREMLYAYWKDYDCTLDYYIFHLFFSILSKEYPEEVLAMPYGQSMNSLVLMHHLGDIFELEKWDKLTQCVSFHKLAFRVSDKVKKDKKNYFNTIIQLYS